MRHFKLTTVISFCSLDARFLPFCIEAALKFSDEIIIPVCDHFYDGSPENLPLLNQIYLSYPNVKFVQFAYQKDKIYGVELEKSKEDLDWSRLWTASSRYLGYFFSSDPDYILFLDADEIIEPNLFLNWLDTLLEKPYELYLFLAYAYFRSPLYQSTQFQNTSLLAKRSCLDKQKLLLPDERLGLFDLHNGSKKKIALSSCSKPMVHHYSWSRTKEELLKKTKCWGHHFEKDWSNLIENEFKGSFSGKDFWSKSSYKTLEKPIHNVLSPPKFKRIATSLNHVRKIDYEMFYYLETKREFNL